MHLTDVMFQMSLLPKVSKMLRLIYHGISLFVLLKCLFHVGIMVINFHEI